MSAIRDKLNDIFKFNSLERVMTLNKEVRGIVLHRRSFRDNVRSNEYTIMDDKTKHFLYYNEEQLAKEECCDC